MKLLSRLEKTLLIIIIVYSFIPTFGGLFRVLELAGGPAVAPVNPRALADPLPVVVAHSVTSLRVLRRRRCYSSCDSLRRHRPATHRVVGLAVVIAGCVSAATGVWMTHVYALPAELQGSLLYWARTLLGFSMISLIGWAVIAIRSRNVFRHSAAMLRAYAIGQGASTQTFLGIGWVAVAGAEPLGPLRDGLMVSAWVLNLLVAELVIGKLLTRTAPRPEQGPATRRRRPILAEKWD